MESAVISVYQECVMWLAGQLVDFVIPEGNFAIESKNYNARA